MAEIVSVKIEGLDKLTEALDRVPPRIGKAIIRRALRAAATPIKDTMIQRVRRRTGFLADHVAVRIKMLRNELAGRAAIGVLHTNYPERRSKRGTGRGSTIDAASVARFLEFGTRKMASYPFMRGAYETEKMNALQAFTAAARAAFQDESKK